MIEVADSQYSFPDPYDPPAFPRDALSQHAPYDLQASLSADEPPQLPCPQYPSAATDWTHEPTAPYQNGSHLPLGYPDHPPQHMRPPATTHRSHRVHPYARPGRHVTRDTTQNNICDWDSGSRYSAGPNDTAHGDGGLSGSSHRGANNLGSWKHAPAPTATDVLGDSDSFGHGCMPQIASGYTQSVTTPLVHPSVSNIVALTEFEGVSSDQSQTRLHLRPTLTWSIEEGLKVERIEALIGVQSGSEMTWLPFDNVTSHLEPIIRNTIHHGLSSRLFNGVRLVEPIGPYSQFAYTPAFANLSAEDQASVLSDAFTGSVRKACELYRAAHADDKSGLPTLKGLQLASPFFPQMQGQAVQPTSSVTPPG